MDKALVEAAKEFKMQWDKSKNWKDETHLGVDLSSCKHPKYRTQNARQVWMMIRRLTRLPPREIFKLVVGQITPILLYEAELHQEE